MLADLKFVDQSIRALFRRHRIALPSLTWRIVSLNVAGLLALSVGIIHLSPFRAGDIDNMVTGERFAIFKVFLILTAVIIVLSILLAGRIAEPRPRV
jgi:hypothetical protein